MINNLITTYSELINNCKKFTGYANDDDKKELFKQELKECTHFCVYVANEKMHFAPVIFVGQKVFIKKGRGFYANEVYNIVKKKIFEEFSTKKCIQSINYDNRENPLLHAFEKYCDKYETTKKAITKGQFHFYLVDKEAFEYLNILNQKDSKNTLSNEWIENAAAEMANGIWNTITNANGQVAERIVRNKTTNMSKNELKEYVKELLAKQEYKCALTGITFEKTAELRYSPDRIDSNGQYNKGNIQIVCWFINRWKGDRDNEDFKKLLETLKLHWSNQAK